MTLPLPGTSNRISFPSRRHRGRVPPFAETCHFAPVHGNETTYTSIRPVSLDAYATHFPSGENCANPWSPGAVTNGNGLASPDIGSAQISTPLSRPIVP